MYGHNWKGISEFLGNKGKRSLETAWKKIMFKEQGKRYHMDDDTKLKLKIR